MSGALIEEISHPFGQGTLTAGGAQYSTSVTGIGTAYTSIGAATISLPAKVSIKEVEISLIGQTQGSSATNDILYKGQASDSGASWDDISSIITRTHSCAAAADFANALAGRVDLTSGTYFKGGGNSFSIRAVAAESGTASETCTAAMKNSSYVIVRYRVV